MRKIDKLIDDLKVEVATQDNESVHVIYDNILLILAKKQNPRLIKKLDKIVEGINFWYA